jgi:hypothetical protein
MIMIMIDNQTSLDSSGPVRSNTATELRIKSLLWVYFWLLIFEGAIRKWIPPLSAPFLVIRDPIALAIWFYASKTKSSIQNVWGYFYLFAFFMTLLGLVQIIVADLPVPVFLYGWRTYVLHIPVIIAAVSIFDSEDIRKLGTRLLKLSIPMTVLMFAQYVAPGDSWLNRGASEGGSQIGAALGHIRPAGTFSFITGSASFVQFAAAFVMLGLLKKGVFPRWLVVSAGVAVVAAMPVSGSRTLVLGVVTVIVAAIIAGMVSGAMSFDVRKVPKIVGGVIATSLVVVGIAQVPLVKDGIVTFTTRWNQAAEAEGEGSGASAVGNRLTGPFTQIFDIAATAPILGRGIGLGSNFSASYLGSDSLSLGESSWNREVNELGPTIGFCFLALRATISLIIAVMTLRALRRHVFLPLLLLTSTVLAILIGNLDQPTTQGFLTLLTVVTFVGMKDDPQARNT